MNVPLIIAGSLALLGAAVHGGAGEILVVRKLQPGSLPSTQFGSPRMTMAMLHASWHLTTIAFLTSGIALLLSGTVLDGDTARGIALVAAGACTGYAVVVVGLGTANMRSPAMLFRHPGPPLLTATAALAWWGALSL
jgi:hypothetical protein